MTKPTWAKRVVFLVAMTFALGIAPARAATYLEDFEAPFPAWQSNWLGVHSDLSNFYCFTPFGCSSRLGNPDGLWAAASGNSRIDVNFDTSLAATILSLALDVAGYTATNLLVYDAVGTLIFSEDVVLTRGAGTDPGTYSHYVINSTNGIGRFSFDSIRATGNTSIDNIAITVVPEPAAFALMLAGLLLLGFKARRRP